MAAPRLCCAMGERSGKPCGRPATSPPELLNQPQEIVYCTQHFITVCHRRRIRDYQLECQNILNDYPWISSIFQARSHEDLPHRWHISLEHLSHLSIPEARDALRAVERCYLLKKRFQKECVANGCGRRNHEIFTMKVGLLAQGLRLWLADEDRKISVPADNEWISVKSSKKRFF